MTTRDMYEIVEREHPITIRGCFYRAVSAGYYPSTSHEYYQKCVRLLGRMRKMEPIPRLNQIPYEWVVDSSRKRESSSGYARLDSFIRDIPSFYGRNYWLDQEIHIEVMTEKDAMSTILQPVIETWNVPFTVFRGNPSDTMCYELGRIFAAEDPAKRIVVLYLGDFDPSGLNISRVAKSKIEMFAERKIEWRRVAIGENRFRQMRDQFGIPVKEKDRLAPAYIRQYGNQCVEVDAIPSDEIRDLLEKAITRRIDMKLWEATSTIEEREKRRLVRLVKRLE